MKAFLIDPTQSEIRPITLSGADEELKTLLSAKGLEYDDVGPDGDRLCFDEDCFISQKPGRFQLDNLAPVAGQAVVFGAADESGTPTDVRIDQEALTARIKFLA